MLEKHQISIAYILGYTEYDDQNLVKHSGGLVNLSK